MQTNLKCFKSDRKFWVIGYGAGHGPLLLRSGKTDEHHTRIDLLILDIRAMEIRSWSEGFEIALVDQAFLRDFRSCPAEMMEPGTQCVRHLRQRVARIHPWWKALRP